MQSAAANTACFKWTSYKSSAALGEVWCCCAYWVIFVTTMVSDTTFRLLWICVLMSGVYNMSHSAHVYLPIDTSSTMVSAPVAALAAAPAQASALVYYAQPSGPQTGAQPAVAPATSPDKMSAPVAAAAPVQASAPVYGGYAQQSGPHTGAQPAVAPAQSGGGGGGAVSVSNDQDGPTPEEERLLVLTAPSGFQSRYVVRSFNRYSRGKRVFSQTTYIPLDFPPPPPSVSDAEQEEQTLEVTPAKKG
ncbi:uncharacterized PPE family protein PPE3-like [Engraulis encrasicolus]|uniref:uncharacterized PPE family protein PPE3-like n=1 Tax=Engraulis encrasicolus TaxID=184585 RepID=UPI002FD21F0F